MQVDPVDRRRGDRRRATRAASRSSGAIPAERLREWRRRGPGASPPTTGLAARARPQRPRTSARCASSTPSTPTAAVVAAGAPWFMTLFGRDSLLTVVDGAARRPRPGARHAADAGHASRARTIDPRTEEEPGRILHEMRFGETAVARARRRQRLLRHRRRHAAVRDAARRAAAVGRRRRARSTSCCPHADRALEWIERATATATATATSSTSAPPTTAWPNQGWKDSWDGDHASPTARSPSRRSRCARCRATSTPPTWPGPHFAREPATADRPRLLARAGRASSSAASTRLLARPDRGWFALGLDRDKRPIDALASNMGHCLWTGIVDEDKAAAVAEHAAVRRRCSAAGASARWPTSMAAYNPMSYHNGSVWPHDNAICRGRPDALRLRRRRPSGSPTACSTRPSTSATGCPSCSAASTARELRRPGAATRPRARRRPGPRPRRCCCCARCCASSPRAGRQAVVRPGRARALPAACASAACSLAKSRAAVEMWPTGWEITGLEETSVEVIPTRRPGRPGLALDGRGGRV